MSTSIRMRVGAFVAALAVAGAVVVGLLGSAVGGAYVKADATPGDYHWPSPAAAATVTTP